MTKGGRLGVVLDITPATLVCVLVRVGIQLYSMYATP